MTRAPFRPTHEIVLTSRTRSKPRLAIQVMLEPNGHAWTAREWRSRRGASEWAFDRNRDGWYWVPRSLGLLSLPEGYTTMRVQALRGRR